MMNAATAKPKLMLAPERASVAVRLGKEDLLNLALVLGAFACVVLLVSPARNFPINDDWAYAQSVERLLRLDYRLHDWTQPTGLGHFVWGVLFSLLFGFSFTTLTAANLVISALCLFVFYIFLRHLDVTPSRALLGTAVLGCNPIYVYLSYSFMTDVTFTAYLLAGSLCYLRALQGAGDGWLWLGSLAAALAYLTRQHGLLLVVAVLFYLWWSRLWTWERVARVAAIPLAATLCYMVWERSQPTQYVSYYVADTVQFILENPGKYALWRSQVNTAALSVMGLFLLPLLRLPHRPLLALPVFLLLALFQLTILQRYNTFFPTYSGNIIDSTGFIMGFYDAAPIWSREAWALLAVAGALSVSLYFAYCVAQFSRWARTRPWEIRNDSPTLMVNVLALMVALVTLFVSLYLFDRYLLALLPFLMLPLLKVSDSEHAGQARRSTLSPRWLLVILLALFAFIAQRDYMEHASVRWQGAQRLQAQGVPLHQIAGGFEWLGWHIFEHGVRYSLEKGDFTHSYFAAYAILDPVFMVSDIPLDGYTEIGFLPYTSWLSGGQSRRVLLLKRD